MLLVWYCLVLLCVAAALLLRCCCVAAALLLFPLPIIIHQGALKSLDMRDCNTDKGATAKFLANGLVHRDTLEKWDLQSNGISVQDQKEIKSLFGENTVELVF